MHKRKAGPGHRILQERDCRCPRQTMLAAQMQKSADKTVAAVSVIITAARPVAVVGKMLKQQVEQLHRLWIFASGIVFERSRCRDERSVSRAAAIRSAASSQQINRVHQTRIVVLDVADARADRPANHLVGRVGGQQRPELRLVRRFFPRAKPAMHQV